MRSLRCEEFVELVTSSLDRALGPETDSGFVEHLTGCEGCKRYLDQMRWVIESLRADGGNASPTTAWVINPSQDERQSAGIRTG